MIRARIVGTGEYLPEKIWTNHDIEEMCDTTDQWIRQRTGIEQRHVAADEQGTSDLAAPAAMMALEDAGQSPEDIDLIICCTVTPDQLLPSTACIIQGLIGAKNAAAFDLNAACSGFLYGLTTASSFIQSGAFKNILLIGAEIQTNRMTWKYRDTAVLFADGAGAVVIQPSDNGSGVLTTYLGADGAKHEMLHLPRGGSKSPIRVDDADKEPYRLYMKGAELFKRAVIVFGEATNVALKATGLTIDDIKLFIPHQANARIIEAAGQRMGFPGEKVFVNIDKVGNTTAACIPIALHQAKQQGRFKEGDLLLFASFGAGVTWGSAIVRW